MSVDRRLLNWGVFLVLLGGIPLAVAQGWIPRDIVARAWELWPFVLIGAGVGLLLRRTPLHALGGIIVAGTCGVILGSLIAVGTGGLSFGNIGCGGGAADNPQILQESGTFEGGSGTGRVALSATCASVHVTTEAGAGWAVTVDGTENARPTVSHEADVVTVRSPEGSVVFPFSTRRSTWRVALGTDSRLDLSLDLNAGDASIDLGTAVLSRLAVDGNAVGNTRLDLSRATVERLDVEVNAADMAIQLPELANLAGSVQGNAASVDLCAASGVGLRLLVEDNITASNNYDDQGLVRSGNAWQTPDYATAATQVELRTTGSAVSFTLNPKDGCR
jgi:hypothetical protein